MIKKIISNKELIAKIALIVAIALITPQIISLFAQDFTNNAFRLILNGTLILSAAWILVLLFSNKELNTKSLLIPVILLFAGELAMNINDLIVENSWRYPYYIVLYGMAIVAYIIFAFNNNKKVKYVLYTLFLIILTFNLLGVFTGSTTSLARLIIGLTILGNIYLSLDMKGENNNENE